MVGMRVKFSPRIQINKHVRYEIEQVPGWWLVEIEELKFDLREVFDDLWLLKSCMSENVTKIDKIDR